MRTDITAQHLPRITENDIHRFAGVVDIRDARAFASELQAFVLERLRTVKLPVAGQKPSVEEALAHKAATLHAPVRWTPSATDIQRGRPCPNLPDSPANRASRSTRTLPHSGCLP